MNKTFLIVYHKYNDKNNFTEIDMDPCFEDLPSWGICRPTTRKYINVGDTLIFIVKINDEYFLKGWFNVGEKIDYISALKRFPKRRNIIISTEPFIPANNWKNKLLMKKYSNLHGEVIPHFLVKLKTLQRTYYQNCLDDHEIDNWKCRRIFLCNTQQFEKCIKINRCIKDYVDITNIYYRNYIVSKPKEWQNLEDLRINWSKVEKAINFNKPLMTPCNQHNVLRFDDYKDLFMKWIYFYH